MIHLLFVSLSGCVGFSESEQQMALMVEKDGKQFVYSTWAKQATKGKTPPVSKNLNTYLEGEHIWVPPDDIDRIAHLMAGDIATYEKAEELYDGYVVAGDALVIRSDDTVENTDTIGVQKRIHIIELLDPTNARKQQISWVSNPKEALQNCAIRSVTVSSSFRPGQTFYSARDRVFIDLKQVADFYGAEVSADGNRELILIQPGVKPPAGIAVPLAPPPPKAQPLDVTYTPVTAKDLVSNNVQMVLKTMDRKKNFLNMCLSPSHQKNLGKAGVIVLKWVVGARGKVSKIEVISNSTGSDELSACVSKKVERWRFTHVVGDVQASLHFE